MSFAPKLALAALISFAGAAQALPVLASSDANGWALSSSAAAVTAGAADGAITGEALRFTGNSDNAATRQLGQTVSASRVIVQFDLQFDTGTVDTNDFLGLWLGSSTGPNIGLKGNCDGASACNGADLFVRTTGTGGSFSTAIAVGQTYHLFGLLEKVNGSVNYNRYSLWVNPTGAEMAGLTGADAVFSENSGISSFSTIGFRSVNLDAGDAVLVDNLSISTVPEPATAALAGLALLGVALTSRRRPR
ncbi:MAG: PEP-CTERM sorting domain-containing protein [Methylotenera sp.]|jgi:hypothetical protein|nr:PEP-CTERM sorting domain-containing protein [Methylotenera sp.]